MRYVFTLHDDVYFFYHRALPIRRNRFSRELVGCGSTASAYINANASNGRPAHLGVAAEYFRIRPLHAFYIHPMHRVRETDENFFCAFQQATAVVNACGKIESRALRDTIRTNGRRQDGRTTRMVRPIACEAGLLPRTHGSSLFTRGETQAIGVATLGGNSDAQRIDDIEMAEDKRFMLHYFFPPSSVGETGRMGGASRREIGHGNLAERALTPIIPSQEDFPFVCRLESTITESNGSSSMATVCAGTLALLDAGVPIKRYVSRSSLTLELFFLFRPKPGP